MNLASRLNAPIPLTPIPLTLIPLWLDAPRVQPLCARTFARHSELFRAPRGRAKPPAGRGRSPSNFGVRVEALLRSAQSVFPVILKGWQSSSPVRFPGHPERMAIIQPSVGRSHRPTLGKCDSEPSTLKELDQTAPRDATLSELGWLGSFTQGSADGATLGLADFILSG